MKKCIVVLLVLMVSTKLLIGQTNTNNENSSKMQDSRTGLLNITELNAGFGLGDTDADFAERYFGLTSVVGYGITKNLQAGIGAGLSFYNGGTLVPLFLDLRGIINFGKMSAYAFGDVGLLFNFSESDYGNKILINPGIGLKFPFTDKLSGNLATGLFIHTTKDREEHDSFINLKLGIAYMFRK